MPPKPNLDFLRTIAVSLVVFDHTCLALRVHAIGPFDPGWLGTFGVFIFFVHTSLVLMGSLERKPHTLDFYIRRIFRIYPLALLAIAVALATHAPLQGTNTNFFQYHPVGLREIVSHCLLIQNLNHAGPIVNVMWTLPLEVQMYVVLPVLFFFIRRNFSLWPLLVLWVLAVAFCREAFDPNNVNLVTVVPMFLAGVMAYVGFSNRRPWLPAWLLPPFLLLIISFGLYHPVNRKGWFFALALGLLLPSFRQFRAAPIVRTSHEIAKYSYGIYLSHPFALVLGIYLLPGRSLALQLSVELLVIAIVSVATYHLLEKPMIDRGARIARAAELRYEQRQALERAPTPS